jgi:two-component system chemotaxis response regulator CheB
VPNRDIIVIGGSAGALDALQTIVSKLPHDLRAAVFVVIHISPTRESMLPKLLTRAGRLPAVHPSDHQPIQNSRIYVAPPDRHLVIENRHVNVVHGPRENRARPAVDPLFRSAAVNYGPRVIGVVLSGALDDGTAGLRAIKKMGGLAIVQDPLSANYPAMPQSAIDNTEVDCIANAEEIARRLRELVNERASEETGSEDDRRALQKEMSMVTHEYKPDEMIQAVNDIGEISMFTCPECQGALWELKDGKLLRYRCHVGHAFSIESLDVEHGEKLESALWSALRALEERGAMARRLASQARDRSRESVARRFEARALEADEHAESIRQMLIADPDKPLIALNDEAQPATAEHDI